jgi:poly-gamma-glutamate synthesis protein (capsule biosynthesis protein)
VEATLVLPAEFAARREQVRELIAAAQTSAEWKVQVGENARNSDQTAESEVALLPDGEGLFILKRPIAFAVPFTSPLENLTLERAEAILAEGDSRIEVQRMDEKPPTLRALKIEGSAVYDDDYPFQELWSLHTLKGDEGLAREIAPILKKALLDPVVHLAAVGDLMLDRTIGAKLSDGDSAFPFQEVAPYLIGPDVVVGNFESALGEGGEAEDKNYTFKAPIEAVEALQLAGFDVVSLANNHALDFGGESLLEAIGQLEAVGITAVGAGSSDHTARSAKIVERQGMKLAFLAYADVPVEGNGFDTRSWIATSESAGIAWAKPEDIQEDVAQARQVADHVIVLLHSGYEFVPQPNELQVQAAHAAIDAGAALVFGHHAHVLQPIEFYREGVIAYGLGNFAFEDAGPPESMILNVWIDSSGIRQIEVLPTTIDAEGRPQIADPETAAIIRGKVYSMTAFFMETWPDR